MHSSANFLGVNSYLSDAIAETVDYVDTIIVVAPKSSQDDFRVLIFTSAHERICHVDIKVEDTHFSYTVTGPMLDIVAEKEGAVLGGSDSISKMLDGVRKAVRMADAIRKARQEALYGSSDIAIEDERTRVGPED